MTTATTITKKCHKCQQDIPLTDFYLRSGYRGKLIIPTEPKHVISECKACMKKRSETSERLSPHETRTASEMEFIKYLASRGIPALPGKALRDSDVDVVALGHVWIEVKYSTCTYYQGAKRFKFSFSPNQHRNGPRGHIIALMCDWGDDRITYHLFPYNHRAFFNEHGKMKSGLSVVPGQLEAVKHHRRNIMTQPMMDEAENRTGLINVYLGRVRSALLAGVEPVYGIPFARDFRPSKIIQAA